MLCNFIPTMLLRCAVLLFCLNFVRTSEVIYSDLTKEAIRDVDERFSSWPSFHNGVRLMRIRKRETELAKPLTTTTKKPVSQPSEKQHEQSSEQLSKPAVQVPDQTPAKLPDQTPTNSIEQAPLQISAQHPMQPQNPPTNQQPGESQEPHQQSLEHSPALASPHPKDEPQYIEVNKTVSANNTVEGKAETNATVALAAPKINLSDPGVVKRAFIVFGGFALLGTAYYFLFYRKKNNNSDAKNTHSSIDPNQFRYGVLKSEDKMNTLESSRVPLTMESDEDDDEDLEIFDLGQKKKSLSYINLQQHDDEIVLNDSRSVDMENLLVDIEDKNSDTLINWSSTGSKSIL